MPNILKNDANKELEEIFPVLVQGMEAREMEGQETKKEKELRFCHWRKTQRFLEDVDA